MSRADRDVELGMARIDEPYATAQFEAMSDPSLVAVVTRDREDYVERAIELAWAELERRGIDRASLEARGQADAASQPAASGQAPLGVRWLNIYTTLVGVSAVGAPVAELVEGYPWLPIVALQLPYSLFQVIVAIGLKRRRMWAWYLNFVLLAVAAIVGWCTSRGPGAIGAGVVLLLNAIYFAARKRLFKGSSA